LKEKLGLGEVVVITGSAPGRDHDPQCAAMGADRAIHLKADVA
jgi:electron transfer flavoprotein alpha/beta subunit